MISAGGENALTIGSCLFISFIFKYLIHQTIYIACVHPLHEWDFCFLIQHHSGFYSGIWDSIKALCLSRCIAHRGDFPLFVNFTQSTILKSVSTASRFKMTFTAETGDLFSPGMVSAQSGCSYIRHPARMLVIWHHLACVLMHECITL